MSSDITNLAVDFEQLSNALKRRLTLENPNKKSVWNELLTIGTGQTIIEFFATIGTFAQFSAHNAFQETSIQSARKGSSIRAIARTLGVRLARKRPAQMSVVMTRTDTSSVLTIPPYTQFSSGKALLFNREAILFNNGSATPTVPVTLHEGQILQETIAGTGAEFQLNQISISGFQVANKDVRVTVAYDPGSGPVRDVLEVVENGIWNYRNTEYNQNKVVQDYTLSTGEARLAFGNSTPIVNPNDDPKYGYNPPGNSTITLTYAVTRGVAGNGLVTAGSSIRVTDPNNVYDDDGNQVPPSLLTSVTAVASESLSNGADETNPEVLRKISPLLFASYGRNVTQPDYKGDALNFSSADGSSVVDGEIQGQRDFAPYDRRFMNVIRYSVLTDAVADEDQFHIDFVKHLQSKGVAYLYPLRYDPVPKDVEVSVDVYCRNVINLADIKNRVINALIELFRPKPNYINQPLFLSDIQKAVMEVDSNIDYIIINLPTTHLFIKVEPPTNVETLILPASGGTLAPGSYAYIVTAVTAQGETLGGVTAYADVATLGDRVYIEWDEATSSEVIGYNVYGRDPLGKDMYLLASINDPSITNVTDAGQPLDENIGQNTYDQGGIYYLRLDPAYNSGQPLVNAYYSSRPIG